MADEMDKSKVPEGRVPEDRNSAPDNEAAQATQANDPEDQGAAGFSAVAQSADEPASDLSAVEVAEVAPAADTPGSDSGPAKVAWTQASGPVAVSTASDREESETASPRSGAARSAQASSNTSQAAINDLAKPGLDLLYDVELDATLQFGSKEMLLRDVLELGPGDVVELDRHIAEPVDLVVGDRIVARGEVVVASGNFALRVTEVATPQMRLESIRCLF